MEEDFIDDEYVSLWVSIGFKSLRLRFSIGFFKKSYCYKVLLKDFIFGILLFCRYYYLIRCLL